MSRGADPTSTCSRWSSMRTTAEGDGPVNAMSRALRKALVGSYPDLESVRLSCVC